MGQALRLSRRNSDARGVNLPSPEAGQAKQVIDGVLSRLNASYVFPEKAMEMEAAIRARAGRKEYDRISSAQVLADSLTAHLRLVSHDKHLRVRFSARPLPERPDAEPTPEMRVRQATMLRNINSGFEKVERPEGNIGYLELRGFAPAEAAGAEKVVAQRYDLPLEDIFAVQSETGASTLRQDLARALTRAVPRAQVKPDRRNHAPASG